MKEFELLQEALNVAAQKGVFNLQDSANVLHCLGVVKEKLKTLEGLQAPNKTPEIPEAPKGEKPELRPHK